MVFHLVLLVFAFVFFVLAATNWIVEPNKLRVIAAGLACATAAFILSGAIPLFR